MKSDRNDLPEDLAIHTGDDNLVREALGTLRNEQASGDVRQRTLIRMEAAARADRLRGSRPWWQRQVSVPLPLLLVFFIAFGFTAMQMLAGRQHATPSMQTQPSPPPNGEAVTLPDSREPMMAARQQRGAHHTYETALYIPRLGVVTHQRITKPASQYNGDNP